MRARKSFTFTLGAIAALAVTACGTTPAITSASDSAQAQASRTTTAYRLGSGDSLRINVFGQPELTGEFEVDGGGAISMPLIGQISVNNLTVPELETVVTERLADGYLKDPRVSAEVTNYRPYYILGEVNTPGEYPYTSGLTVLNAVAAAGGYTYRANQRVVFIKSLENNEEVTYRLNAQLQLQPGDTIRIGERLF